MFVNRTIGLLFVVYGVGLLLAQGSFVVSGLNPAAPDLSAMGMTVAALVGAAVAPLGLSLFRRGPHANALLRVAAWVLLLNAVVRATPLVLSEIDLGIIPYVEVCLTGVLGGVAFVTSMEPLAFSLDIQVDASAERAWQVIGEDFGDVQAWSPAIAASGLEGPVGVGALRSCDGTGFGPFPAGRVTERLTDFDREERSFSYVAEEGLPAFVRSAENRWFVESVGPNTSVIRSRAQMELAWWAAPAAIVLRGTVAWPARKLMRELKAYVEG